VEIDRDHACTLALLANGATVFAADEDNLWKKMLDAVREHGCIVITMEY
jgi:hypothetical protein